MAPTGPASTAAHPYHTSGSRRFPRRGAASGAAGRDRSSRGCAHDGASRRRRDLEAAARPLAMPAALDELGPDDLAHERLDRPAGLRTARYRGGQRAAVAADDPSAAVFLHVGGAAE